VLNRAEWLTALERSRGGTQLRREMEQLLDEGAADPAAASPRFSPGQGFRTASRAAS
jgi:hypothetical protein